MVDSRSAAKQSEHTDLLEERVAVLECTVHDVMTDRWPRYMTMATACQYVDCSEWTIREWVRRGWLAKYEGGGIGGPRYDRAEIDRCIRRRKIG